MACVKSLIFILISPTPAHILVLAKDAFPSSFLQYDHFLIMATKLYMLKLKFFNIRYFQKSRLT